MRLRAEIRDAVGRNEGQAVGGGGGGGGGGQALVLI